MPTERILDLLDQAQAMGFQGLVAFAFYSEPLLEERNIRLAHEARRRGMKPFLSTNGDALVHDDALSRAVVDVYEFIVVGLYDYETNDGLEKAKTYWRSRLAGADLRFSPIGRFGDGSGYTIGIPRALVPTNARIAIPDLTFSNAPCHRPSIRMIVQYDGTMVNCCEDIHGAFDLGSVDENGLAELWFSERHTRVVNDLVAGRREEYELCQNCPLPPTGPPPNGMRAEIAPRRYGEVTCGVDLP